MHICMVNDYSIEHIGGAVSSMFEQKKALEEAGHIVIVLQLGKKPEKTSYDTTNVIFIPASFVLPKSLYDLPMLRANKANAQKIRAVLQEHQIEILHLQSEMSLARLAQQVGAELQIPSVYTIHTIFWEYPGAASGLVAQVIKRGFQAIIGQKLYEGTPRGNAVEKVLKNMTLSAAQAAEAVISPSSHQRRTLLEAGLTTACHVVPNPFESIEKALPQLVKTTSDPLRLLWIGRCEPEKRPLEFIEAIRLAGKQTGAAFTVDFIGSGSLLERMKTAAYDLPNVTFLGKKTHPETIKHIDACDMTVLSSYHFDNQPMTIVESISRYRPVLYCDEQLTDEMEVASFKSEDESPAAMAHSIVTLAENRDAVVALSQGAKQTSSAFSHKAFVATALNIYTSLK